MTYTLLGSPAMCFDLVRVSQGARAASLLLTALSLTEADTARLAAVHPGTVRRELWALAMDQTSGVVPPSQAPRPESPSSGTSEPAGLLLRRMEHARLGTAESMSRLIRMEILDWTWMPPALGASKILEQSPTAALGSDVMVDAVVAAYAHEHLEPSTSYQLSAPFEDAALGLRDGLPTDLPPVTGRIVGRLANLDAPARQRLLHTVEAARPATHLWVTAMHEATWATQLSGRLRTATAAQLLAVRAFRDAGFTARDGACGAWNAVSGVVQASVVQDVLSIEHLHWLTRPWVAALGHMDGMSTT